VADTAANGDQPCDCIVYVDIAQEKTMENITLFKRESLKHIEPTVKDTLPTKES